ncbi:hypothetical protein HPO96_16730 [Kribbella sandramycini]|uniref:Ig-like domain-containing protein n=1 Tax=Kribbella sandramycini TaxID=60450 RepID=A0A7Y4L060_9ACTN|nr:hypothetical protein [Kribbella sandramycini]MBB6565630.1 hypothetical protein [Kribbella sandramycini]NOL41893.1 hypothetical protein [Kribbella sandramycini]
MTRRVLAVLLAAPLAGAALTGTAHAADPDFSAESIVVDRSSVAVASLNTVAVTITVKGKVNVGNPAATDVQLYANLKRTGAAPAGISWVVSDNLKQISGTAADGVWQGKVNVPSTANGTLTIDGIALGRFDPASGSNISPTPVDGPVIDVKGVHQPKFTATPTPAVSALGTPVSIRWQVTDSETGQPYGSKLKVIVADDNGCVERVGAAGSVLTDTAGVIVQKAVSDDAVKCLLIPGSQAPIGGTSTVLDHPGVVTAVPAKTSAKVGTIVPVNGVVKVAPLYCPVNLQRLYGASQWRTVGTVKSDSRKRYTLQAQPAYKGRIPYRVQFPTCSNYRTAVSPTFHIMGT